MRSRRPAARPSTRSTPCASTSLLHRPPSTSADSLCARAASGSAVRLAQPPPPRADGELTFFSPSPSPRRQLQLERLLASTRRQQHPWIRPRASRSPRARLVVRRADSPSLADDERRLQCVRPLPRPVHHSADPIKHARRLAPVPLAARRKPHHAVRPRRLGRDHEQLCHFGASDRLCQPSGALAGVVRARGNVLSERAGPVRGQLDAVQCVVPLLVSFWFSLAVELTPTPEQPSGSGSTTSARRTTSRPTFRSSSPRSSVPRSCASRALVPPLRRPG